MSSISLPSLSIAAGALAFTLLAPTTPVEASQAKPAEAHAAAPRANTCEAAAVMRDLWVEHIFWIRNVVAATLNNVPAQAEAAEQQAIANARAIASAIEPFYGKAAKDKFFTLLGGHYEAVKDYLIATAMDDVSGQAKATDALTSNADAIASFLNTANPLLNKDAVASLLLAHGSHHIQQIQELRARQYSAEAKTWGEMKSHMYMIADAVSDALAKQFAAKR
jgi:hypothetical protein